MAAGAARVAVAHEPSASRTVAIVAARGVVEVAITVVRGGAEARALRERADRDGDGRLNMRERRGLAVLAHEVSAARLHVMVAGKVLGPGRFEAALGGAVDDTPVVATARFRMRVRGREAAVTVSDPARLAVSVRGADGVEAAGEALPDRPFTATIAVFAAKH